MQPDLTRQSPAGTGLRVEQKQHRHRHSTARPSGRPDVPTLLRHHADFIDVILVMICTGEPISLAGRRALAFSIERIRHCAEVIR
jgi:hypothetical protein